VEEGKIKLIKMRLDQKILYVVIDVFSYMIENYNMTGVIDHAAWIIEKEELEIMIAKLKPFIRLEQKIIIIPMHEEDYNVFVRLIDYAGYIAPKQKDRALLESLYDG